MRKFATTTPKTQDERRLEELVEKSSRVIFRISSVWPFDFFPSKLIISENQVDVVMRDFFMSEHVESIRIKDIQQVSVETSVLFATLTISMLKPESMPIVISYLTRSDALRARQIIYGLMAVAKEGIDVSTLDMPKLIHKLELIGIDYD